MHFIKAQNVLLPTRFYSSDAGGCKVTIATGKKSSVFASQYYDTSAEGNMRQRLLQELWPQGWQGHPTPAARRPTALCKELQAELPAAQSRRWHSQRLMVPTACLQHRSGSSCTTWYQPREHTEPLRPPSVSTDFKADIISSI